MRVVLFFFCITAGVAGHSQSLEDSNRLFNWAETNYPQFFSPAGAKNVDYQGYLVRYYEDTNIYLATRDSGVYYSRPDKGGGIIYLGSIFLFISEGEEDSRPKEPLDITDIILSNRSANCAEYAGEYVSNVADVNRSLTFEGNTVISVEEQSCTFTSNGIPNHDFGEGGSFATPVSAVENIFTITSRPVAGVSPTSLTLDSDNAILLNGVKVDLFAAACFGVGDERIGCNDINQPWRFDPMSPNNRFGTDIHNAHTQPNGAYHYHGNPMALFDFDKAVVSPLVGFAADGFPIYGSYFDDNGVVRKAESSYQLKSGARPNGDGDPGGEYDGTYRDDYEFIEGSGDLDQCNGMIVNGVYGYYVIDKFPYILGCYMGTPNDSFQKGGQGGGPPPRP